MSLTLWKDISPLGQRLREPTSRSPHVLVIGGGVTGLISSWVLLDRGYHVTILSEAWTSDEQRLTSQIAGALYVNPNSSPSQPIPREYLSGITRLEKYPSRNITIGRPSLSRASFW